MREIPKLLVQAAVILTSAQVCNECFGVSFSSSTLTVK
jgi:hypothetical protein